MELSNEDEIKLVQSLKTLCEATSSNISLLASPSKTPDANCTAPACSNDVYPLSSLLLEFSVRKDQYLANTARDSFLILVQLASQHPNLEQKFTEETGSGLTVSIEQSTKR